jgi:hypothetical protein
MRFYTDDSPLGIVVLNFIKHFQFALEGEFDKWTSETPALYALAL